MGYTVSCLTTLSEAEAAWELLSPHEHLMDEWQYRALYFQHCPRPLHFYQLARDGKPVALLPLQENELGKLEFFGGIKFYKNSIFMHDTNPDAYRLLFAGVQKPMQLELMNEPIPGVKVLTEDVGYYVLNLEGLTDWHSYLERDWHGQSKKNLKAQMKKIAALGVEVVENRWADLEHLAGFNIAQFGANSHFHKPHRLEYLKQLSKDYKTQLLSVVQAGKPVAVGFGIVYKGVYYGLTSGHDLSIKNIGKFLILARIEQAIQAGAELYEAGRHDYGWKEHFHFHKKNLFRLA